MAATAAPECSWGPGPCLSVLWEVHDLKNSLRMDWAIQQKWNTGKLAREGSLVNVRAGLSPITHGAGLLLNISR